MFFKLFSTYFNILKTVTYKAVLPYFLLPVLSHPSFTFPLCLPNPELPSESGQYPFEIKSHYALSSHSNWQTAQNFIFRHHIFVHFGTW